MSAPSRRGVLGCGLLVGLTVATPLLLRRQLLRRVAVGLPPEAPPSDALRTMIAGALADLDPDELLDTHVHVLGLGTHCDGCTVHPENLDGLRHPIERGRFEVYALAAGITDMAEADAEYLDTLLQRRDADPHLGSPKLGRGLLYAMDAARNPDGSLDHHGTRFTVPDAWVLEVARQHPDDFVPVCSVHPYRDDALDALDAAANQGAVAVKWLPSAHGIDPSDPRCRPFYDRLATLDLTLLSHAGHELAVEAADRQALGNPLLLRHPLDAGVRVVVLHCASLGEDADLDDPERPLVPSVDLFARLMADPQWEGRLWGELSAVPQVNRCGVLPALFADARIRGRLVNGSDYPLPAIHALVHLSALEDAGVLDPTDGPVLRELFTHNPLLFDLVLKRRLRWTDGGGTTHTLPTRTFLAQPEVFPRLA